VLYIINSGIRIIPKVAAKEKDAIIKVIELNAISIHVKTLKPIQKLVSERIR